MSAAQNQEGGTQDPPAAANVSGSGAGPSGDPSGAEAEAAESADLTGTGGSSAAGLRKKYLRLKPLGLYELPYHPDFETDDQRGRQRHPELGPFLSRVLSEALAVDVNSWKTTGSHTFNSKSAANGIEVTKASKDEDGEIWFSRTSKHPETGEQGVKWEEFDHILRKDHSKNEAIYTPNVYDSAEILRWNQDEEVDSWSHSNGWKDVGIWIVNMYHGIPWPLRDRVFVELVVVGVRTNLPSKDTPAEEDGEITDELVVVQLPVDILTLPDVVKNRSHHRVPGTPTYHRDPSLVNPAQKAKMGRKLVYGEYSSVEKVARMRKGEDVVSSWVMATVSDGKGVLPQALQRKAVPAEIVKDVEYVYGFLGEQRGKEGWPA